PDRNPDNWIVLLAEPQVRGFAWSAPRSSSSSSSNGVIGLALALQGLAVADTGQVTGPVEVDQLNAAHRITLARPVAVGVPGSEASQVPALAAPGPIPGRRGFRPVIALAGQATVATDTNLVWQHGRLAARARCYGSGRLRLTWELGSPHAVLALPADAARAKQ